jgi:hypothetical protein
MLKLGMVGINEGNGHPYSYSAVFNGYNEKALEQECPFEIIKQYLKEHHRNQEFIKDARITHILTQDRKISESISRIANIENVVDSAKELIENVDAVIFARDDIWNHWDMMKPFIEAGVPIYCDKVMGHDMDSLKKFIANTGESYPIMTASSFRFSPEVEKAPLTIDKDKVKTIHAISPCIWIRYAAHLLDPICSIFGYNIDTIQSVGEVDNDTVFIKYKEGLSITVQVIENISLPIEFRCFSDSGIEPYVVQYTDPTLKSYFLSIYRMLDAFTNMVRKNDFSNAGFSNSVLLNSLILAGEESRFKNGEIINFADYLKNIKG